MVNEKPTVKIYCATYIGSESRLRGQTSMVMCNSNDEGNLKAQFDERSLGEVAFGWNSFPRDQFDIDYFSMDGSL